MVPADIIWLFSVLTEDQTATLYVVPPYPTLHPYRSACDIGYSDKKLTKMVGNSASYLITVGAQIDRL